MTTWQWLPQNEIFSCQNSEIRSRHRTPTACGLVPHTHLFRLKNENHHHLKMMIFKNSSQKYESPFGESYSIATKFTKCNIQMFLSANLCDFENWKRRRPISDGRAGLERQPRCLFVTDDVYSRHQLVAAEWLPSNTWRHTRDLWTMEWRCITVLHPFAVEAKRCEVTETRWGV